MPRWIRFKFDISPLIQISENEFSKVFLVELFNSLTVKMYYCPFDHSSSLVQYS